MIAGIEYSVNDKGEALVTEMEERPYILNQTHRHIITSELEFLSEEYPFALKALEKRYNNSIQNRMFFEFQIVRQWIKCHHAHYDGILDIDENGIRNFEYSYCPKRGECQSCDILEVCYPVRSTKLRKSEINVLRLLVAGLDEQQISDTMNLSVATIKNHRNNMLKRLDLHKTTQLIDYWHKNKFK
jgi:DNA-binding NarL/FixJ family response regulator